MQLWIATTLSCAVVSLMGVLILILSLCTPAIRILTSAFEWPRVVRSLNVLLARDYDFFSIGIGVAFIMKIIVARAWLKLRMGNKPLARDSGCLEKLNLLSDRGKNYL